MTVGILDTDPFGDKNRFVLTAEEQSEMADFERRKNQVEAEMNARRREIARAAGLCAENLADLKSNVGVPFVEKEKPHRGHFRTAVAAKNAGRLPRLHWEPAYFCPGCGWVRGVPNSSSYNAIRPMAGSSGEEFKCKICGTVVGEEIMVQSLGKIC
jgi:hypothetical protein